MSKPTSNPSPLLPVAETLTVEFKSDRARLPDHELVEALVCLANTEGGELWLGVEDDGKPTGLHDAHQNLAGLQGMVAAKTSPSLTITVNEFELSGFRAFGLSGFRAFGLSGFRAFGRSGVRVAQIVVPKSGTEAATTAGVYLRRRIKHDGTPECVPMLPHERISRASSFGLIDVSAQPVAACTLADFDPLERERLRQAVQHYGGDRVLLDLDDEALDGALGLEVAPGIRTGR